MPKKGSSSLGRSLIKEKRKFSKHQRGFIDNNLVSVTEQTSVDDFLYQTALEVESLKIICPNSDEVLPDEEEKALVSSAQDENQEFICIPRRPHWNLDEMTKEEINNNERESFLAWRRKLATLQETDHINLTPFEKNFEVWRQLWRVVERSDIIVQILDARNPLLFQCTDFEAYVKEIDENKMNILLLNKADFLTESQRKAWCDYYDANGIQIAFFSALEQGQRPPEDTEELNETKSSIEESQFSTVKNNPVIFSREDLVTFFKMLGKTYQTEQHTPTVGFVGYPNVGKSSTINVLLMSKRVCVSATPGKTKHFQTFLLDADLRLCDCPGLVFPNFVSTKAEMVVNGILPIDQLTEAIQPVSLVTSMIPRHILEKSYNVLIPRPREGRDYDSPPTAEEFLNAHGFSRGFMTQRGMPDNSRSARYILKDFVNGKLLYCHAPPGVKQEEYHTYPDAETKKKPSASCTLTEADKRFFARNQMHIKGRSLPKENQDSTSGKPWKKHYNRNKKEKLRRVYTPYEI